MHLRSSLAWPAADTAGNGIGLRPYSRGAILLKAVLALSLVVVAGIASFLAVTTMRYREASHRAAKLQARLWSESGIEDAMNRIRHDPFWKADGTESWPLLTKSFDDGEYEVRASPSILPNHVEITSLGKSSWSKHKARQSLLLDIPTLFALIATEEVRLNAGANVEGAISSGKNIIVSGDALIGGPVQTRENFNGPTRVVSAPIYELFLYAPVPPEFDPTPYLADGYRQVFGGPFNNTAFSDTVVYVLGSSEMAGVQITNGTLLVQGDLRIVGPCVIEGAKDRMALIVTGNLTIEDRGSLTVRGPVYVFQDCKARGKAVVEGTIMARNIELGRDSRARPQLEAVYGSILGLPRSVVREDYNENP